MKTRSRIRVPLRSLWRDIKYISEYLKLARIHDRYSDYTMIPKRSYIHNLMLVHRFADKLPMSELAVVECGSWRGGMSFGMVEMVPECQNFHIFDSFEGVPRPTDRDGQRAINLFDEKLLLYKRNIAPFDDMVSSLEKFGITDKVTLHRGWFSDTVHFDAIGRPVGILRMDGDWYDSTMTVLERLYDYVVDNGLIIIDDYYTWPGCSQAVHDFLSKRKATEAIQVAFGKTVFLVKNPVDFIEKLPSEEEKALRLQRNVAQG